MITEHAILSYIATAHDWVLARQGSLRDGWHVVYKGRITDYDVYLDVDEDWVYMQCPILTQQALPQSHQTLCEYLLRASSRMFLAKFCLWRSPGATMPVDWVVLVSESPVHTFDAGMFRLMSQAIATYAEQYDREIRTVAMDAEIAGLVAQAESNTVPGPQGA